MFNILLSFLLVLAAGFFFYPYIYWPTNSHFGVHCMWALFRKKNEKIPKEIILRNNLGVARFFQHYLVAFLRHLFGKEHLDKKVMLFQFACITATAIVLYFLAIGPLSLCWPVAFFSAALYLFTISRPGLVPDFYNVEPFYNLFTSLACALLLDAHGVDTSPWPLFAFAALSCFAALNAKPNHLVEPALIGLWALFSSPSPFQATFALGAGALAALLGFYGLFRQDIYFEGIATLSNYARKSGFVRAGASGMLDIFRYRWRSSLKDTPLTGLAALSVAGVLLTGFTAQGQLLTVWLAASVLSVLAQKRFELAYFHILLPAACLLAGLGLGAAFQHSGLFGWGLVALFAFLARRAISDVPFYMGNASLNEKLGRAITHYTHYWDTRMHLAVTHHAQTREKFITWGIVPQVHYLADEAPISSYQLFHDMQHPIYPPLQSILIQDAKRTRPKYIYDFNAWTTSTGRFNPLTFFAASGLAYRAKERRENMVTYELMDSFTHEAAPYEPSEKHQDICLYVRSSPAHDLLRYEQHFFGQHGESEAIRYPLASLMLLCLQRLKEDPLPASPVAPPAKPAALPLASHLFGGMQRLLDQDPEGVRLVRAWASGCEPYLAMSPALDVAAWAMRKALHIERPPLNPHTGSMGRLPPADAWELADFILSALCSGICDADEADTLRRALTSYVPDDTPYRDQSIANMESALACAGKLWDSEALRALLVDTPWRLRETLLAQLSPLQLAAEFEQAGIILASVQELAAKAGSTSSPRLVLFGMNRLAALMRIHAARNGAQVQAVLDSTRHTDDPGLHGGRVLPAGALAGIDCDAVVICAASPKAIGEIVDILGSLACPHPVLARKEGHPDSAWHVIPPERFGRRGA